MNGSLRRPRRWLGFLVLALIATPLLALGPRVTVYFLADFDALPQSQGPGSIVAQGGDITVSDPTSDVFSIARFGEEGNLVLMVGPNLGNEEAELLAELDEPTDATIVDVSWAMEVVGGQTANMTFRVEDDGDSGMIDIEFDDGDDSIKVGGQSIPTPSGDDDGDGGEESASSSGPFTVRMRFQQAMLGPKTWTLTVIGEGYYQQLSGPLFMPGDLSIGAVRITRPAVGPGASAAVDDLMVSSPGGNATSTSSQ